MAITPMNKFLLACHRSQVTDLLERIQQAGICEMLTAEQSMVCKDEPDLQSGGTHAREIEGEVGRIHKSVSFLGMYAQKVRGMFAGKRELAADDFIKIVTDESLVDCIREAEQVQERIELLEAELDSCELHVQMLRPWEKLDVPVESLRGFDTMVALPGIISSQKLAQVRENLTEEDVLIERVDADKVREVIVAFCPKENAAKVQKMLRAADFEAAHFEDIKGTISHTIQEIEKHEVEVREELEGLNKKAKELAENHEEVAILGDHHENLLERLRTQEKAAATEQVVIFEGWVKRSDFGKMQNIVKGFSAASVNEIEPAEGEVPPVEIKNGPMSEPFETVTRLYGMPAASDPDPTVFLAPFFALFFGICLTDAAYGLVMIGFLWWLLRKIKGDKKFVMMLIFCSITTFVAGALTGGWCGDMVQAFSFFNGGTPEVTDTFFEKMRERLMWFDPLEKPMYFFNISLGLGYLQIIAGVFIGFVHKLRRGEKTEAIFDHLSWFIWLNCLLVFGLGKAGLLPSWLGAVAGYIAIVPALMILLFSEREGNWGARIGMGFYNVFSTVFYVGDVLSYIRLMALGMVTAGFGMAINEIVRKVMEGGAVGWILGAVIFIGGHIFNIANSALGSFVHSMRLQFVEFFTKFLAGGGKQFDPLRQSYRYVSVKDKE